VQKKMISRRDVISRSAKATGALLGAPYLGMFANTASGSTLVNDIHSQLNPTPVNRVVKVQSAEQLAGILLSASQQGRALSLAGKRHAMGGQQFGSDTDLIDMTSFNKINSLDKHSGIIEVESGAIWPSIIDYCWNEQRDDPSHRAATREDRLGRLAFRESETMRLWVLLLGLFLFSGGACRSRPRRQAAAACDRL
jgi:hypothetical protein